MSGAEALAVISVAANVIQVVGGTISVVKRVASFCDDVIELPKVLKEVELRLPLLVVALQKRSDPEVLSSLSEPERKALANILCHIQSKAKDLKKLLDSVFPPEDASTWQKSWKAAKSFRHEKKAQAIVNEIENYFQYLTLNDFQFVAPAAGLPTLLNEKRPRKPLFMVNIRREGELVGREDVMARLTSSLSQEDRHNRIALVALGGMGKTRVALEYALKYKNSNISVFWIHASSKARIAEDYGKIAKKANIVGYEHSTDEGLELVKDWFESEASGNWLMIIDNADDIDLLYGPEHLADYFPHSDNGASIMTTRNKQVGFKFANSSIVLLEALNSSQSQDLLVSKFSDEVDPKAREELAEELGGIPLALVQAAAFIHMNSISVEEYLELYRQSPNSRISLLSEDFEDSVRDREIKNPVATTWSISFEYIERHAPLAGELLKMMCILDYQAIPISLIHSDSSQHKIIKALGILQAFCLIHSRNPKENQKKYDMHRLVHISMRNWLALNNQLSAWTARTLKNLAPKYPNIAENHLEEVDLCAAYLPHALSLLSSDELATANGEDIATVFLQQRMIGQHAEEDVICASCAASLMQKVAISHELFDKTEKGRIWAMKAFSLHKFVYGEQSSETIGALFYLAACLYGAGQQDEAQKVGMRAVELIEGAEHPPKLVARGYEIRAFIAVERDMPDEAESLFQKIVEIRRDIYGPRHSLTLKSVQDLASFYYQQDLPIQSEQLLEGLLEVRIAMSGPNHPTTLACMSSLAMPYCAMERYDDALRLRQELYVPQLESFGPNHTFTIINLLEVSILYSKEGKYDQGLELGLELLDRCTKSLAPEHRVTLQVMSVLSSVYEENGCGAEAEAFKTRVLDFYRRVNIPQNPRVAREMTKLCSFYEGQERYKKAEPLREQVVEIETGRAGGKSPEAILAMCELGINYSYQGLHSKASKYQYSSLQLPLEVPKYKSSSIISRMVSIVDGWVKIGNLSDGEKMARDAAAAAREYIGLTHATTISALTGLAGVCFNKYEYEEAETLYREALALRSRFPKPEVARNITDLARVLSRRGNLAEAESEALQAKEIISTIPKARSSLVTFNETTLASIYVGQGRYSEAEGLYWHILTLLSQQWKTEESTRSSVLGTLAPLEDLAFLYWQSERHTKAEHILSKTISIRRKVTNSTHVDTLLAVASLGDVYNSQERFTEGLTLLLEYKILVTSQGLERDDKPFQIAMAHIQHGIAKSYTGLGKYGDAESFARLALSASKEIYGDQGRFTLRCEAIYGPIYRGMGSLVQAAEVEVRMADAWTELLGRKNLTTLAAVCSLAKSRAEQGQVDEAKMLEEGAAVMSEYADFGLGGEEEQAVEQVVEMIFWKWDESEDGVMTALEGLVLG